MATRGTASNNKWQQVVQKGTKSGYVWQQGKQWVTTSDSEWQRVVISANFTFFEVREEPTTKHPKKTL